MICRCCFSSSRHLKHVTTLVIVIVIVLLFSFSLSSLEFASLGGHAVFW